jgi:hypothetical protein
VDVRVLFSIVQASTDALNGLRPGIQVEGLSMKLRRRDGSSVHGEARTEPSGQSQALLWTSSPMFPTK